MQRSMSRRVFAKRCAATAAVLVSSPAIFTQGQSPNNRIMVGVLGMSRGAALAREFAAQTDVTVKYVCDPDRNRLLPVAEQLSKAGHPAIGVTDLRQILDDGEVDAVVVATPDHWHAPATILACAAGKHVYVEKPCSHNPAEGEWMVAAARKHNRVVQMGTQRRSWPALREAVQRLQEGIIGRVVVARSWYNALRGPIGRLQAAPVPEGLDWGLWQGPAPRRPYLQGIVHYNWHWFWHWGTGEIGNNGVHGIDLCRWGLGVDYPEEVTSGGAKLYFDDDQETPDSQVVTFRFGRTMINWEGRSWHGRGFEGERFGASFLGEKGSLVILGSGYKVYDRQDKLLEQKSGPGSDRLHIENFLNAIRQSAPLNAEILEGHKSTLLCHLGSIAHRVGRVLRCDPANGHILNDLEAMRLWTREYEPRWEPKV